MVSRMGRGVACLLLVCPAMALRRASGVKDLEREITGCCLCKATCAAPCWKACGITPLLRMAHATPCSCTGACSEGVEGVGCSRCMAGDREPLGGRDGGGWALPGGA